LYPVLSEQKEPLINF